MFFVVELVRCVFHGTDVGEHCEQAMILLQLTPYKISFSLPGFFTWLYVDECASGAIVFPFLIRST